MKKLTAIISCFCICALLGAGLWKGGVFNPAIDSTSTSETSSTEETQLSEQYLYQVDEGKFSLYIGGKVITEDKLGDKITDVTVTAGWKSMPNNKWITEENLRAEVYAIEGVSEDVAVALKFLDKGEALTTTHYYVIMNPDADLSAVEDYVIRQTSSNLPTLSEREDDGVFSTTIAETSVSGASSAEETQLSEQYLYRVDKGRFSLYIGGRVITEDKLGGKITDVTVTAGWESMLDHKPLTEESLRAEVYAIEGVSEDVAVALKFLDKGEALTTTHYYVIMNPDADLSAVEDYVIRQTSSNLPTLSAREDDGVLSTTIAETSVSAAVGH